MINYRMSQSEMLKEFWNDYHRVIKPRCFKICDRNKRELLDLQKKRPGEWQRIKKLVGIKTEKEDRYNVILWSKVKKNQTEIKTCCWISYFDEEGKRKIILLPSHQTTNALVLFTPGFFNEWKDQMKKKETGVDLEREFFLWVEGNYMIYHDEDDHSQIDVNLNNLGAGIGNFKKPCTYIFKHFMGVSKIGEMQEKVGPIKDPIKLWNEFYKEPEIIAPVEIEYNREDELNSIFDEIAEKYG